MKIQVNNATPSQLDFLVLTSDCWSTATLFFVTGKKPPAYSTDWAQGGPIIEREEINIQQSPERDCYMAFIVGTPASEGPTPLIAAMRCFIASKLGDEVDVPDELKGE